MITMRSVPWHDVDDVWPDMEPHVAQAVEYSNGMLTAEVVREALLERDMQALVAVDEDNEIIGVAVTEILQSMSGLRVLEIVALAGDRFDEWQAEGDRLLRSWARSADTPVVRLTGRRGWTRKLATLGWKEDAVMMTLDLRN